MAKVQEPESLASYPATLYLDGPALPEEDEEDEEEEEEEEEKRRRGEEEQEANPR